MRFISQLPGYVRRCAAIVAAIGLCLTFATGCATASTPPNERPEVTQQPLVQKPSEPRLPPCPPDYPIYNVTVSQDGTIMMATKLSGEEIYNRDPDVTNPPPAVEVCLGDLSQIRVELPAVTTIDGEQYEGLTTFILSFDEPQEWMFDAYNQAIFEDRLQSLPSPEYSLSELIKLSFIPLVLLTLHDEVRSFDPVTLIAVEDPEVVTNSIIAEAYNKGMSAWEVVHGMPEFDLERVYEYSFHCRHYDLKIESVVETAEIGLSEKYGASDAQSVLSQPDDSDTYFYTPPTSLNGVSGNSEGLFRDVWETGVFIETSRGISLSTEAPCEIIVK